MRRALVSLLPVLLAGCAAGPDYHPPAVPANAVGAFVAGVSAPVSVDDLPDDWWQLYHDPTLAGLVHEALARNTDLRIAEANLHAAGAVLLAARSRMLPETGISAGATYGRSGIDDEVFGVAAGAKAPNQWFETVGFGASYQVDLFGEVRRGIEAARADAQAAAAARDIVRVSVVASTTAAYADICALGRSLAVAQQSADEARRALDATRKRAAAGVDTRFDVVRAEALLAQTEAAVAPLRGQRDVDLFVLAALIGQTPAAAPRAVLACTAPLVLAQPIPVGDGTMLIRRRPDIRLAERNLAGASARIGVAMTSLYPRISLGASAGVGASRPGDFGQYSSFAFGLGPLVSWNFPNVALARARIAQARAGNAAALARFDGTVLQALSETEQALSTYRAERDAHEHLVQGRDANALAAALATKRFRDGASTYLDQLNAEQSAIAADAALAASERRLTLDQVALFRALGGGWRQTPN